MTTHKKLMSLAVAAAVTGNSIAVQAAGFALIEQNASGLGNAFAGQAASAQDASTVFFNPAGMTMLPGKQVVFAAHAIRPKAEFTNTGSAAAPLQPFGDNGGDAGDWAWVPNAYLSWQLSPQWYAGVGINAPFGLKTEYNTTWIGRFYAVESELKTINVNPSIAYKINDQVSIGGGISWQRADATLSNMVNYSGAAFQAGGAPALAAVGGAGAQGLATVTGDDDSWGWNVGALFNLGPTRIGITYRSAISYTLSGTVAFSGVPAVPGPLGAALAANFANGPVQADLKLPGSASWSIFHQLNPKWDLLGDITWTDWSTLNALNVVRSGNGALLSTTPLNWKDTWRVSAGANYHYNNEWTLRFGVAYDQTPTGDLDRTPRIPDESRTWLAFGAQYRISKAAALDFGYAHLFMSDPTVNLCGAATAATAGCLGKNSLVGAYDADVNIVSAQFRYSF